MTAGYCDASADAQLPELRRIDSGRYVRVMTGGTDLTSTRIEAVVTRFRAMMRSIGASRGLNDADLDELIQDVRIRLWRAGEAGKDLPELGSSYLYQVSTTAALDLIRRRRSRAADRTDDVTEQAALPDRGPSPEEALEASDLAARVEQALEEIPKDRRVAVRFHLAGYDRHDIARALGWTEPRARNLLYRGLEDLRRRLTLLGVTPVKAR